MTLRLTHERKVLLYFILGGLPATVAAMVLLWLGPYSAKLQWTATCLIGLWWGGFAFAIREEVIRPLQTLSNLIAALAEGDFSLRAREARNDEALGLALLEVNQLSSVLQEQRMGAVEAAALLGKVMGEIDVAVFTFDERQTLQLVNPAGADFLGARPEDVLGQRAADLGLADALTGETPRILDMPAAQRGGGRWELRRGGFRQEGRPHVLVLLSDLSRALRDEERQAWKRLVRVLSHEINNSLAPIHSMSESLRRQLGRPVRGPDWERDADRALDVIGNRAEALIRFMQAYARLAKLPPPAFAPVRVDEWVRRVIGLETRMAVEVVGGPPLTLQADGDQLDQLLINLVGNAVDASLETGGAVRVGWSRDNSDVDVWVEDGGPGVEDTANLFVPFFTTKRGGTGIGLTLSREIAEGHGGTVTLANRRNRQGCVAHLKLPLN